MSEVDQSVSLHDVAAGLLTPFDQQDTGTILYRELENNARWLYDEGIRVFLACANISEYDSLSNEERIKTARVVTKTLPDDTTVLGGAGGSTKTAIKIARQHQKNGCDGIMIIPPRHAFKHERGVVEHYHRIADAVDIGIVPYFRGYPVTVKMVREIASHPNVTGIKWAIGNIELFSECVEATNADMTWICGMAEPSAPSYYLEGADGFSAGVTNFEPRYGIELFDALKTSNWTRAKQLRDLAHPYMNFRSETGEGNIYDSANSIPAVKAGLEFAGQYGGPVRPPLVELSEKDRERARSYYEDLQSGLDKLL
jgi:4-hydroxy-tetrahydrodipicolinate synthase